MDTFKKLFKDELPETYVQQVAALIDEAKTELGAKIDAFENRIADVEARAARFFAQAEQGHAEVTHQTVVDSNLDVAIASHIENQIRIHQTSKDAAARMTSLSAIQKLQHRSDKARTYLQTLAA